MPRHPYLLLTLNLLVVSLCPVLAVAQQAADVAPPQGFTTLFNGRDLSGWHGRQRDLDPRKWDAATEQQRDSWNADMHEHWTVKDGVLVNDGHGVYLTTDEEFGDMELLIEYRTVPKTDSGIYLRGTPQVQIWDSSDESVVRLGATREAEDFGITAQEPKVKIHWYWRISLLAIGIHSELFRSARTSVWLNGQQVVDHAIMENYWDRDQPLFPEGVIQLQTHGGEIQWRNIFVRRINANEANAWLREHDRHQYVSLFNGTDLAGWTGATDSYHVVDAAIQCKEGKGGVLHTTDEYADFCARLEFQLPPGGNNGLAIRYPGNGDTAYVGMCELQVLDNSADKYAELDPRQFHGSAYGMVAAKRGYLRPVGEWNYQQVTVSGSKIRVELNGTVILDTDLSEVSTFMAEKPHPGKDRTSGFFGFAGHSDAVRFRDIEIRRLEDTAKSTDDSQHPQTNAAEPVR